MSDNENTAADKGELQSILGDLPVLPQVATQMLALNSNCDNYFEIILALASQDPIIAAKIIQLANSVANAGVVQISTIHRAVSRVGASQVATLAAAIALAGVFTPTNQEQKDLWRHSIQTAVIGKRLARSNKVNTEESYLTGLLHAIGSIIVLMKLGDDWSSPNESAGDSVRRLINNEVSAFGFEPGIICYEACKAWQIPKGICAVLKMHHSDTFMEERTSFLLADQTKLLMVLNVASKVSLALLDHKEELENTEAIAATLHATLTELKPKLPKDFFGPSNWFVQQLPEVCEEVNHLSVSLGV